MEIPFTRKMLVDWGGVQVLKDAESLLERGLVLEASYEPPFVKGSILWNNRPLRTGLKIISAAVVESLCPCYTNRERGIICAHVIALCLLLVRRATDPLREEKHREEMRRVARLAAMGEEHYIRRVPSETPGGVPARIVVILPPAWLEAWLQGTVRLHCAAEYQGGRVPLDQVPRDLPLILDRKDEALLFVLEDISEGPAKGTLQVSRVDFLNVIKLHGGRSLEQADGNSVTVNEVPVTTHVRMELDNKTGELILSPHTELPFLRGEETPRYLVAGRTGYASGADNLWPLSNILPDPYHPLYFAPVRIPRPHVLRFLETELPVLARYARIESEISRDLFTVEPAQPRFRLVIHGSAASLAASLYAIYDDIELVAAKPDAREHFGLPDPNDLMRYTVRNLEAEKRALQELNRAGLQGDTGDGLSALVGHRLVMNFLATQVPRLRRRGWQVMLEGRIVPYLEENTEFAVPVVQIRESSGMNWFEVGFKFEDSRGRSISDAEIQLALRRGESFFTSGNRTILIDSEAIDALHDVFRDCASLEGTAAGTFRVSGIYTAFVKSSLDRLDGVDVECPSAWRARADRFLGAVAPEPVSLGEPLNSILRGYQKQGVSWLRFLEKNGFCGLLADEMGLGKTLQTLAWLQLTPVDPTAQGKPALVVCPSSLTENWADEAARFVPQMRVLVLTGPERHEKWSLIPSADLVITSYALLRRDIEAFAQLEFSTVVLDEAQHIKNRSTQNARAAKSLRAVRRLVLTGTPVENSVADLWSIMDFLMPGYLGSHESFRENYELPMARGGSEGEAAQLRLKRKLQPFLLRRLKKDVSQDLPDKIERISLCSLTPDQ
ncbi:MAG: DEAD/DEAH box helicase, partial [Kiritimatiellia bacterium]